MSDPRGSSLPASPTSGETPASSVEAVDSAFAGALEPEVMPTPENLVSPAPAAATAMPSSPRWGTAIFLLGGTALAMQGALVLHMNDDAGTSIAALRRDTEAATAQTETRVKALEAQGKLLAGLEQRLKAAEAGLAGLSQSAVAGPLAAGEGQAGALAELETRLKAAEARLAAIPDMVLPAPLPPGPDLSGLPGQVAGLQDRLKLVEAALSAPKVPERATETRIDATPPGNTLAAQLVVGQSVLAAMEQGKPFESEVAALQKLGVDAARLGPLQAMAGGGVPTNAMLAATLANIKPAMLASVTPEPPKSQSWLDQIGSSAAGLVKVTREGDVPGADVSGKIAGLEAVLAKGDLPGVVAAWARLPEAAQKLSQDWINQVKARMAGADLARALVSEAIASLGGKKP